MKSGQITIQRQPAMTTIIIAADISTDHHYYYYIVDSVIRDQSYHRKKSTSYRSTETNKSHAKKKSDNRATFKEKERLFRTEVLCTIFNQ